MYCPTSLVFGVDVITSELRQGDLDNNQSSPQPHLGIKEPMLDTIPSVSDTVPSVSGNSLNSISAFVSLFACVCLPLLCVMAPSEWKTESFLHRAAEWFRWQGPFPVCTKAVYMAVWLLFFAGLCNPGMAMMSPTEDIIAFENNESLSINCSGNTNGVPWLKVNGQDPNSIQIPGLSFNSGDQVQYLTIPAAASSNNTNVTCKVVNSMGTIMESTALNIYIQGPLGPPTNFSVATAENLTFTLSWVAPFSFHVNKDPPDIYGYVLCTNISKYGCWISTNDLNCTFPNTCTYTLNAGISGEKLVTAITFSLCAINGAGSGQYATIIVDLKAAEHLPTLSSAASNGTISASYSTISVSSGTASASYGIITAFLIVLLL